MPAAGVSRCASLWIGVTDRQSVLFDGSCIRLMVEVTIVEVVDVSIVLDGCMTASGAVLVIVVFVDVRHHLFLSTC